VPAGHAPGVDASKPRATVIWVHESNGQQLDALLQIWSADEVPASGELRRVVYRPRGIGGTHTGGEEAAILEVLLEFSNRGAKTVYIFRHPLIGTTAPYLSSKVCVKLSVT